MSFPKLLLFPLTALLGGLLLFFAPRLEVLVQQSWSSLLRTSVRRGKMCRSAGRPAGIDPAWIYKMHAWSKWIGNYSQGAQDFYLEKIFSVIGSTNNYFVEFGFNEPSYTSGGSGANTHLLYEKGWRGLLLDGDHENKEINLQKHYLFANNIVQIFAQNSVPHEMDYLSVDMDSHDLWVFRAILQGGYRPRVITTEFNQNYLLDDALTMIDPTLTGNGTIPKGFSFEFAGCAWGASAKALWKVATEYGYKLVGRVGGLDLIWIRGDLLRNCYLLPEFKWFFHDAVSGMGRLAHPRQNSTKNVGKIVDYETFLKTADLTESNKVARKILKTRKLECFQSVYKDL